MKYAFGIAALAAVASAGPTGLTKRSVTDVEILNYALTLEHLEDTFYRGGLAKFSEHDFIAAGFPHPFYQNLCEVSKDETTHVSFLTAALGSSAVQACTYNFPYKTPKDFVALAAVLEGVGVSAYLGAAASIASKAYLTAAGSILTIEARHSSYLRASENESPFPYPFDTPLDFDEVYTLASPLIKSCPSSNSHLPTLKAFPELTLATTGTVHPGDYIKVLTTSHISVPQGKKVYGAWITITGPIFVDATPCPGGYQVKVPSTGVDGQSYVVLQTCNDKVNDSTIAAGPLIVEVDCGCN